MRKYIIVFNPDEQHYVIAYRDAPAPLDTYYIADLPPFVNRAYATLMMDALNRTGG